MNELQRIVEAFADARSGDAPPVLATVVKTSGSTYRRPGARMLILPFGKAVGAVSGGCLERDVVRQAQRVFHSGEPRLVTYDSTSNDEIRWGLGLGCNGTVDVLLEEMRDGAQMAFLARVLRDRRDGALAKVFAVEGAVGAQPGDCLWLDRNASHISIPDPALSAAILADAAQVLESGESLVRLYETGTGRAEVFIEALRPPVPLVIFGGGHDAVPLARLAKQLGWHVTVVDGRPGHASAVNFPMADALIPARPDGFAERVNLDSRTAAVVMNHNYLDDLAVLRALRAAPLAYLGLLGPKPRAERLLADLAAEGAAMPAPLLACLYGPVGLDIGADNPEEIALAVAAEITAVLAGRAAGMSRDRSGPLHARREAQAGLGREFGSAVCAVPSRNVA
jgi:xanthine/CO dehydrogenase XdhC/CoxF family maturation factor